MRTGILYFGALCVYIETINDDVFHCPLDFGDDYTHPSETQTALSFKKTSTLRILYCKAAHNHGYD